MNAWIGVIGTIVGALIAGLLLHVRDSAQRRYARNAERRSLLIEKFELLHEQLTDVSSGIQDLGIELIGMASLGDKLSLDKRTSNIPISSALMLSEFYAPEIMVHLKYLRPKITEFYKIMFSLGTDKTMDENERLVMASKGLDKSNEISDLITVAQTELVKISRTWVHGNA